MFGQLTEQFQEIVKNIRGLGKITDENIKSSVRKVRRVLIEADVNIKSVKSFTAKVQKKAQGTKTLKSIKPGEQFISIIKDEIVGLLRSSNYEMDLKSTPSSIMLCGLQGVGKTTTAGKIAYRYVKKNKSVLLVSLDVYRPAAIDQLIKIGEQINVPVFETRLDDPLEICKEALKIARSNKNEIIIFDTAGRTHVDEMMMDEIRNIVLGINPNEILLAVDGMAGQDAISSAKVFTDQLNITGLILTKMDGDSRGGAALSIKEIIDVPIKFLGNSESLDGLEKFDPEKIARRILGLGDIISLVEKAEKVIKSDETIMLSNKISKNTFNLNDFKLQLRQMRDMGPLDDLMTLIPTKIRNKMKLQSFDKMKIDWNEAIINSMTKNEREKPEIIDGSRRMRISKGSGRSLQDVNTLLNKFKEMKYMMKKLKKTNSKNNLVMMPNYRKF